MNNNCKKCVVAGVYFLLFIGLCLLFYRQSIVPPYEFDQTYISDLPVHIKFASEGNSMYSIVYLIFAIFLRIPGSLFIIASFLASVVCLTVFLTSLFIKFLCPKVNLFLVQGVAFLVNFVGILYFPPFFKNFFLVGLTGNVWHNSTYLCMKLIGIIVIILFLKIYQNYLIKMDKKEILLFSFLLIVINSIKPNFFLMFAPAMLVFLSVDFFKNIKKNFKPTLIFGCSVLPSITVLLFQYLVLFSDSEKSSGIAFGFNKVLSIYTNEPILAFMASVFIPIIIIVFNFKKICLNNSLKFLLLIAVFGIIEFLFLYETGARMSDANFAWGSNFATFCIFIASVCILLQVEFKNKQIKVLAWGLLSLHLVCGIIYFINLLLGKNYM